MMRKLKHGPQAFLTALLGGLLAVCATACSAATGSADAYTLGKEYRLVPEPQKPDDPKKVVVEEFFCYCCPHCFHADPGIEEWRKHLAGDVSFRRVPNSLGRPDGKVLEQAFFIAQTMGILDKVHTPLFKAIHEQGFPMSSLDSVRDLFVEQAGIKPADFDSLSSSFVIDSEVRNADEEAQTYQVTSVPTVIVGGKYMVNGASPDLAKLLDFLVDKVRKERKV
jgi:protein dithiol oxidoreductase (disulfide-forming)